MHLTLLIFSFHQGKIKDRDTYIYIHLWLLIDATCKSNYILSSYQTFQKMHQTLLLIPTYFDMHTALNKINNYSIVSKHSGPIYESCHL